MTPLYVTKSPFYVFFSNTLRLTRLLPIAAKTVPLAYGIHKLSILTTVVDEKVSIDDLTEKIESIEEYVRFLVIRLNFLWTYLYRNFICMYFEFLLKSPVFHRSSFLMEMIVFILLQTIYVYVYFSTGPKRGYCSFQQDLNSNKKFQYCPVPHSYYFLHCSLIRISTVGVENETITLEVHLYILSILQQLPQVYLMQRCIGNARLNFIYRCHSTGETV